MAGTDEGGMTALDWKDESARRTFRAHCEVADAAGRLLEDAAANGGSIGTVRFHPPVLDAPGPLIPERDPYYARMEQAVDALYQEAEQILGDAVAATGDMVRERPSNEEDPVFRPHHYARYVIEPITFIVANRLSFEAGNVIKYVCREDAKNGLEDLKKARRYLDIMIEVKARRERVEAGEPAEDVWKERL